MSYTGIDAWGHGGTGLLETVGETTVEELGTDEWMNVHEADNGTFYLSELRVARGLRGMPVERDLHFTPMPLSEVKKRHLSPESYAGRSSVKGCI